MINQERCDTFGKIRFCQRHPFIILSCKNMYKKIINVNVEALGNKKITTRTQQPSKNQYLDF